MAIDWKKTGITVANGLGRALLWGLKWATIGMLYACLWGTLSVLGYLPIFGGFFRGLREAATTALGTYIGVRAALPPRRP